MLLFAILVSVVTSCCCLDNGLGLVPPMGWLSWLRYRCTTDCNTYPNDCISENLIMRTADMVSKEFKTVGYEYVMVDDCWLAGKRAPNGSLLPDPIRFPRGMKFLTDYVHSKGLKFGIYEDYGTKTCAGYPGSMDHLKTDAFTFADWGVDYVNFDGCNSDPLSQPIGVQNFSLFLNQTKRPIFLNVEWPLYINVRNVSTDMSNLLIRTTNMARVFNDIDDNWGSLLSVINFYKTNINDFTSWAGPGHFNDPDMLLIGNNYISQPQEQLQMTMWSMFAAPLIMSNDLRNISNFSKSILTNRNIISINQDPLGIQGRYIKTINYAQFWIRPLIYDQLAIAIVNLENRSIEVEFSLEEIGFSENRIYFLKEVYEGRIQLKVNIQTKLKFPMRSTSALIFKCENL